MSDIEKEAEEYKPMTREGLTAYFAQADADNDGRVDWNIDILVTLILNAIYDAEKAARLAERRELLEWVIAWGQSEMKVYFDDHEYHMSPRYEDALASELIDALKSKLEAK